MSANDVDDALQRLNYFNGERLAAADFRAEQAYHVGMRRVLNRSLYSPGIVVGLEVEPSSRGKHYVVVRQGLAFDNLGREIFLPTDMDVQVCGAPSSTPGVVFGNLLVVSYREMRRFPAQSRCLVGAPYQPCGGDLAWGAPTRIRADAVFEFLDSWPSADSGKIVLSQVELNSQCEVVRISLGVRKYAVPAKPQTTRPISLEGEKDIDSTNPKALYFHIDGGYPETATLYLRGGTFSTLYYTELGQHDHGLTINPYPLDITHKHEFSASPQTSIAGAHRHAFYCAASNPPPDVPFGAPMMAAPDPMTWRLRDELRRSQRSNPIVKAGDHQHDVDIKLNPIPVPHIIPVQMTGAVQPTGMLPAARPGPPLSTFKDLVIKLNGNAITSQICDQLESKPNQSGKWKVQVGPNDVRMNGVSLNLQDGTGEIDLVKLGIELKLGENKLEFVVSGADYGGNLQYNLYVG